MERITSAQNAKIKYLLELQAKSRERRQSGLFVVEGVREIEHCASCGYQIQTLFVCPEICTEQSPVMAQAAQVIEVSRQIYDKVAYRGGTEGMIAEVKAKRHGLDSLNLKKDALVMVLESVEKPGNLGAVLRSADAAAADAVIICDPLTDIYNPNLIRSSIGAVFTVPVAAATSEDTIAFLKERNFEILTAQLQDSELYYNTDMTGPTAIVMGTESTGLSDIWRQAASAHIRIPMLGRLDSLNVSVSAAILLFEAIRQRQ